MPLVADITHFFTTSAKKDNDAANKIREKVLTVAQNPPPEFLTDPTHGSSWAKLRDEFNAILKKIVPEPWTHVNVTLKAGRGHKFDFSVEFYNDGTIIATKKIEFKKGAATIKALPQVLSLLAKDPIMPGLKYHDYFYDHGLDAYLATDAGLTAAKPTKDEYSRLVYNTSPKGPLHAQMRANRALQKLAKNAVVNKSIKDYLDAHAATIDVAAFAKKVTETQADKHFILWANGAFHYDTIATTEITGFAYSHVKNGNAIIIVGPDCSYELLLRWRNDKGILMPAWQIKMKRI